jgi:hypothetical protein
MLMFVNYCCPEKIRFNKYLPKFLSYAGFLPRMKRALPAPLLKERGSLFPSPKGEGLGMR